MKRIIFILAILAVAGCAANSKTEVKRGKKGLHIDCSGLTSSWEKCFTRAATACSPGNYKVIARSGSAEGEPGDYLFGINPAGYTSRSMIVICR